MFLLKLGSELQNLIEKTPMRSEDIHHMQTESPRNEVQTSRNYITPIKYG